MKDRSGFDGPDRRIVAPLNLQQKANGRAYRCDVKLARQRDAEHPERLAIRGSRGARARSKPAPVTLPKVSFPDAGGE